MATTAYLSRCTRGADLLRGRSSGQPSLPDLGNASEGKCLHAHARTAPAAEGRGPLRFEHSGGLTPRPARLAWCATRPERLQASKKGQRLWPPSCVKPASLVSSRFHHRTACSAPGTTLSSGPTSASASW